MQINFIIQNLPNVYGLFHYTKYYISFYFIHIFYIIISSFFCFLKWHFFKVVQPYVRECFQVPKCCSSLLFHRYIDFTNIRKHDLSTVMAEMKGVHISTGFLCKSASKNVQLMPEYIMASNVSCNPRLFSQNQKPCWCPDIKSFSPPIWFKNGFSLNIFPCLFTIPGDDTSFFIRKPFFCLSLFLT